MGHLALREPEVRAGCLVVQGQLVLLDCLVLLDSLDLEVRLVSLVHVVHRDSQVSRVLPASEDFQVTAHISRLLK